MKKRQKDILISVVMPVYNAEDFVAEAVTSILNQSYQCFEFIIVDDASTDKTYTLLKALAKKDARIRLVRNRTNQGVSRSVKRAIRMAQGDFIARMDADDVSHPARLEKQVAHLIKHPRTVAVGGQCVLIDKDGQIIGEKRFPTSFQEIYHYIYEFVPLQQPTLMVARNRLPRHFEYYVDGMNTAEEIELIFKLFMHGKVENLPDYILMYRMHGKNTSLQNPRQTFMLTLLSRIKAVYQYGYRPGIRGITITFLQAITLLILPERFSLFLYQMVRRDLHFASHAPTHFSPAYWQTPVRV